MKETKKNIGIFGGSFDPPHKGHLMIGKLSIKKLKLKKLYWLVTNKNPLKKKNIFFFKRKSKKIKNNNKKRKENICKVFREKNSF